MYFCIPLRCEPVLFWLVSLSVPPVFLLLGVLATCVLCSAGVQWFDQLFLAEHGTYDFVIFTLACHCRAMPALS